MKKVIIFLVSLLILTGCGETTKKESSIINYTEDQIIVTSDKVVYDDSTKVYTVHNLINNDDGLIIDLVLNENCPDIAYYTFKNFAINDSTIDFDECEIKGETYNNVHHHYVIVSKEMLNENNIAEIDYVSFDFFYDGDVDGDVFEYLSDSTKAKEYQHKLKYSPDYLAVNGYELLDWEFTTDIDINNIESMFQIEEYGEYLDFDYVLITKDGTLYKVSAGKRSATDLSTEYYMDVGDFAVFGRKIVKKNGNSSYKYVRLRSGDYYDYRLNNVDDGNTVYYEIMPEFEYKDSWSQYYGGELKHCALLSDGNIYSFDTIEDIGEPNWVYHFENKQLLYHFDNEKIIQLSGIYDYNGLGFRQDLRRIYILTDCGYYYQSITSTEIASEYADKDPMCTYDVTLVKDEYISSIIDDISFIAENLIILNDGRVIKNNN